VTRALATGIRMTPAELAKGRLMRAPDGHDAPVTQASVQDFITKELLGGDDEAPEEENENPQGEEPEGEEEAEEAESEEEPTDEEGEALEPIAPPVSWDKDAKEAFAQLPRELQATVAEREAQRDKAIQQATTEAANAKRNALVEANAAFAEHQRQYASHLEQIAAQIAPQRPDPTLAATDPGAYVQALAIFEAQNAQYQQMMQQSAQAKHEAEQRDAITRQEELNRNSQVLAEHFGDTWTDNTQRQALLTDLEKIGAELGYPVELMRDASATDIIALATANDWKAKAEKYDALQKNKMEAVRAAKGAPRVAKPGTSGARGEATNRSREAAWSNVKSSGGRSGDAAAAWLDSIGVKL
jgi:hypothetical protein